MGIIEPCLEVVMKELESLLLNLNLFIDPIVIIITTVIAIMDNYIHFIMIIIYSPKYFQNINYFIANHYYSHRLDPLIFLFCFFLNIETKNLIINILFNNYCIYIYIIP